MQNILRNVFARRSWTQHDVAFPIVFPDLFHTAPFRQLWARSFMFLTERDLFWTDESPVWKDASERTVFRSWQEAVQTWGFLWAWSGKRPRFSFTETKKSSVQTAVHLLAMRGSKCKLKLVDFKWEKMQRVTRILKTLCSVHQQEKVFMAYRLVYI